jgi:quinol monooxygenase YgiN
MSTTTVGVLLTIEAKPGREEDVANLFTGARSVVEDEPDTLTWFAIRLGPSTFGVFDAFADASGRQAHLEGAVPRALTDNSELFAGPPDLRLVDVLADKLPAG